jgi:hypothetical protein
MRAIRLFLAAVPIALALATAGAGVAQEGPGGYVNPGRDCQTIVNCRFTKGGSYRGCVSSYSCRVCRFVASSCQITGARGKCQKLRCTWG